MKRGKLDEIVPAPSWWLVAATGLAAVAVALASVSMLMTGQPRLLTRFTVLGTFVHEGGHALMSVLTGGGVYRVAIFSPDSGVTWSWVPSRLSSILTSAAGYAMPSLAGLGGSAPTRCAWSPPGARPSTPRSAGGRTTDAGTSPDRDSSAVHPDTAAHPWGLAAVARPFSEANEHSTRRG
ncbi:M50 family metallopeptidase [Amycolatopsis sp. NPDC051371]|uniref:M50 family metallopeptidase n=1 Tax=Amycolatopsis sp. NPDC051371 TaxID=3155800 RepID=UPI00341FF5E5